MISFRIQWFDLAVQGTLRSLLDMITALKSAYIIPMPVCIPSPMYICLWTAWSSMSFYLHICQGLGGGGVAQSWTLAHQVPLSMGFSGQAYWSGLSVPSPRDLSDPGTELGFPTL